jgi:hypothetical protein
VRRSSPDVLTREKEFDDGRGKDERLAAVKINHSVLTRRIDELYADAQVCAQVAGLAYVSDNEPGIVRQRRGRGWSFRDAGNRPLTDREVKARILALAIPPAWRDVWICPDEDGHILAVGVDDKALPRRRRQSARSSPVPTARSRRSEPAARRRPQPMKRGNRVALARTATDWSSQVPLGSMIVSASTDAPGGHTRRMRQVAAAPPLTCAYG